MANELDRILKNSDRAEFLEDIKGYAQDEGIKIVTIVVRGDGYGYDSQLLTLGVRTSYEALGILELGKWHVPDLDRED